MWEIIIPAMATVVVAIVEGIAARERKKQKIDRTKANERAERRETESRLSMQMADATLQLSIVTANALTGGKNNGNVERARLAAEQAQKDYEEFLRSLAAHQIAK